LGGIAWTIESGADVFLIDMVPGGGGRDMVATYVLWWRFPQMAFAVTTNLSTVAFPGFAATHTDTTHVRPLFRKVALTSTAIIFVMVVGIGLWLTPFVRHWVGSQYGIPDGPRLALLMALLVAFRTLGNLLGLFWLATGKAGLTTVLCWVQAVVKVALAFVLIRIDGVHGLVTASVVSILVQVVGIGWPLAKRGLFELRLVVATGFWLAVASAIVLMLGPEVQDARFNTMVIGIITTAILASGVMGVWLKSLGLFPRRIKNSAEVKG
jgi:O-antigen/teichoic acid export membrane protein